MWLPGETGGELPGCGWSVPNHSPRGAGLTHCSWVPGSARQVTFQQITSLILATMGLFLITKWSLMKTIVQAKDSQESGFLKTSLFDVLNFLRLFLHSKHGTCHPIVYSLSRLFLFMDCSLPGFPVLHCLLEFAQTHVRWVGDAIQQPSHPPSPAFSSCPRSFPAPGSS